MKQIRTGNLTRSFNFNREAIDEEARTVSLSMSSDAPVERWFGMEVLSHDPSHVDLGRLNDGAPLLMDHNTNDQIGRVETAMVDGKRGQAVVRFSKSARGSEIFNDVVDGIRQNISIGYRIHEMGIDESRSEGDVETYVATAWQPYEVSVVSVPADNSIGISRSAEGEHLTTITNIRGDNEMAEEVKTDPVVSAPVVDEAKIARDAMEVERKRSNEIDAISDQHPQLADIAKQFKSNGRSVDEFRAVALEKIATAKPAKAAIDDSSIGMSQKETRQFSIVRAVNALATGDWSKAGFEREMSDAQGQKLGKQATGFYLPSDVQRDLTVGTATAGGHTVATDLLSGSFIDMLRNRMTVMDLGATMMTGLNGNVAVPRQTGGATAYWVAESGAVTESAAAFDQVSMTPKTVGAFSDISRKLLLQSSIDVEAFVRNELATTLALEIDRAAINGSGSSNQPTGILNVSGIGSVVGGTNGAAPDWADIVDLESAVAIDNADNGALNYLTNAAVRGKLLQTEKASGTAQYVWADNNTLRGYNAAVSNQVPSNLTKGSTSGSCSAIIFGNFNDLMVGMWGGLDIALDASTGSASGTLRVVALQDVDVAVRHAESFAAMKDATT